VTDICMTDAGLLPLERFRPSEELARSTNMPRWFHQLTRSRDIEMGESLRLTGTTIANAAVFPGEAASTETIDREKTRDALVDLVQKFAIQGLSWTAGRAVTISPDTATAAAAFFRALPAGKTMPRISPNGEGGLSMVWEDGGDLVIAVLDGWLFHLVVAATTPCATYHDNLPFNGQNIPQAILESIPAR
jgi:hypothetical protein